MIQDKIIPLFYTIMNYPTPLAKEEFLYIDEIRKDNNVLASDQDLYHQQSWKNTGEILQRYLKHIHNQAGLFKSLPFVKQIYLCNSITFNALHEDSDIDLYIITQKNYIRLARFRSVLIFRFTDLKRSKKDKKMKFCLSFYSDEKDCNIYHLRNIKGDKYLSYRVAHCVLLYSDNTLSDNYLWEHNKELLDFLPNHPKKQNIVLDGIVHRDNTIFKKIVMYLSSNILGKTIQTLICIIRKTIITYKKLKLNTHTQQHIIISDTMLKFHDDQRDLFEFRQKSFTQKKSKK